MIEKKPTLEYAPVERHTARPFSAWRWWDTLMLLPLAALVLVWFGRWLMALADFIFELG